LALRSVANGTMANRPDDLDLNRKPLEFSRPGGDGCGVLNLSRPNGWLWQREITLASSIGLSCFAALCIEAQGEQRRGASAMWEDFNIAAGTDRTSPSILWPVWAGGIIARRQPSASLRAHVSDRRTMSSRLFEPRTESIGAGGRYRRQPAPWTVVDRRCAGIDSQF